MEDVFSVVFRKSLSGVPAALPPFRLFRLLNDVRASVFHRRARRNSSVSLPKKRTGLCFDCQSILLANITDETNGRCSRHGLISGEKRKRYPQAYSDASTMAFCVRR
jgi:hypothetical protein